MQAVFVFGVDDGGKPDGLPTRSSCRALDGGG